jgi:hypothetical protein
MSAHKKIAILHMRLKGFEESDTTSQVEGFLDPGKYVIEEYLQNHPNQDTDYALVQAPALGAEDTWICTRWKDQNYADISDEPEVSIERLPFDDDPLAIREEALVNLLPQFEDFIYDLDEARYPFDLPGVRLPQAPPYSNNCCTFVEALLVRAWADVHADFEWNRARHGQMMILSNDDYFSPVTAVIESQMGIVVPDPDTSPHPWTVIQGWRRQWRDGHTFIVVDHHEPTDRILTLESNSSYRLNGVGFRMIGNIKDFGCRPPDTWWMREDLWEWKKVQSTYLYRQQAWLKVKDRSFSGL